MKLIRPFTVDDAALLSSSIGESGAVALEGDMTDGNDAELMEGDESGLLLFEGDEAESLEWETAAPYALGDTVIVTDTDYHHAFESLSGGTSQTVTITIASPGVVTWTAHGLAAGTPVAFSTTGALPTGLTAGTVYYVKSPATDSFSVSATVSGSAINTSGTQSGTHTAVSNPNIGMVPRDHPEFWLDLGASNRWAMFDQYNGTQSTAPERIEVQIQTSGATRVDALALININAAEVQVISESDGDEIYNETVSLTSTDGITDWYAYFFEEIVRRDKIVFYLPPYVAQTVTVILTDDSGTVSVGTLILGRLKDIGATIYGGTVGIVDYSRKDTDDFGNYTIVERAFSDSNDLKVWCDINRFDEIRRSLTQYRATPLVWIGSELFSSLLLYGFYRSFDLELTAPTKFYCSLEIEGLT
jgi:hypothetical protein